MRKIYGIFVAGGSGTRMGASIPKQFLELDGEPILQRTIRRFSDAVPGLGIITVLPAPFIGMWKEMCLVRGFDFPQTVVPGGITRFHSVRGALEKVPDGAIVMIQDGVRPLFSVDLVASMASRMQDGCRALAPVVPVVDTLKWRDGSYPDPDRSAICAVQTPQCFFSEDIKAAYALPYDTRFTDDASVLRAYGKPLDFCEGERFNIKITTKEDLELAAWIIGRNNL